MMGANNYSGRLSESEKQNLTRIIKDISKGNEIASAIAYGSRVAGYANKDSDYDVIIVLNNYKPKVKYRYVKGEIDISALLVNKEDIQSDAGRATLGEFVAGRLLNVYEPLIGEDISNIEHSLKRRVILESLEEIEASFGEFSCEIVIPVEYFLFDKLKKRATIYPPVLYSYAKTYGESLAKTNIEAACLGFLEALKEIKRNGLINIENGNIRVRNRLSESWTIKLSEMIRDTKRGLTQYAVHGYAGTVGLDVIGKELLSKIARTRKGFDIPVTIKHPRKLWSLEEGTLIVDEYDWFNKLLEQQGFKSDANVRIENAGEMYSVSKIYSIEDKNHKLKVVIKNFSDIKALKWIFLNIWTLLSKRFDMNPMSRLYREYSAMRKLRDLGLNTPKVISIILDHKILVTEYIDGPDLAKLIMGFFTGNERNLNTVRQYGQELGKVHSAGYTLGDTKPSNILVSNNKIYLVDLEQMGQNNEKGWDIAEFVYYSSKFTLDSDKAGILVEEFLDGYLSYGRKEWVKESLKIGYLTPFQPMLAPNVSRTIRRKMKDKSS